MNDTTALHVYAEVLNFCFILNIWSMAEKKGIDNGESIPVLVFNAKLFTTLFNNLKN